MSNVIDDSSENVQNCVFKHNRRKRGMQAVLAEVATNTVSSKRRSMTNANYLIKYITATKKPRGNPKKAATARVKNTKNKQRQDTGEPLLHELLLNKNKEAIESLSVFVERNLSTETQKSMAIHAFIQCCSKGKGILQASDFSSSICSVSSTTPIISQLMSSRRGQCAKHISLYNCTEFQQEAREYVRANANVKGSPNMTSKSFAAGIAKSWGHDIHEETARQWLHKLGFKPKSSSKGVYFDGHERDDVRDAREKYLDILDKADQRRYGSQNLLRPEERPIIRLYHDESTFYANAQQSTYWNDGINTVLRQKSMGQAIMVSDFIDEVNGFLRLDNMQARKTVEHQKDGYFCNDQFIDQVTKAVDIFETKYPNAQGLFLFDNAPSHWKMSPDALNVNLMNVGSGGKQPVMRDKVWQNVPQSLTLPDGSPKGMKLILEER